MREIIHYPSLKTVLMVESVLKSSSTLLKREELKKKLKKKVMHQTLNIILEYLEDSGKIIDGHKGILWIYNNNQKLRHAVKSSLSV